MVVFWIPFRISVQRRTGRQDGRRRRGIIICNPTNYEYNMKIRSGPKSPYIQHFTERQNTRSLLKPDQPTNFRCQTHGNGYGSAEIERPTPSNAHLGPANAPNSLTSSPGCGQQPPRPIVRLSTAVVWVASLAGVPHLAVVAAVSSRVHSHHTYCLTPTFDMQICNLYYEYENKTKTR